MRRKRMAMRADSEADESADSMLMEVAGAWPMKMSTNRRTKSISAPSAS